MVFRPQNTYFPPLKKFIVTVDNLISVTNQEIH